jgi:ATP/maltotriose-dependent transcriptional regulator MalT
MASSGVSSYRFVGRRAELASLLDAFTTATSGSATAVVVGGEAGVGKTRLLTEFVTDLPDPVHIVWGRCMADGGLPYGAFRDGLRSFVRSLDDASRHELRAHTSPELAHFVPDLSEGEPAPAPSNRKAEQTRIFELLLQAVAFLGEQHPLVLVIDDLHWADRSTQSLVAYLIQHLSSERVLVCATYRTDEVDRTHPLCSWLAEHLRARRGHLELHRLTRAEIAEQLDAILQRAPEDELIDEIYARSEGNPFFAEELLAAAEEHGAALPTSIRELLLSRLARLSNACKKMLRAASAIRTPIDPSVLSHAANTTDDALFDALREAVERHILEPDRDRHRFVFRHALLREAAYSEVLPGERQQLHRRLAEAIELARTEDRIDAQEASSELAFHWRASADARRAIVALLAAARAATAARGFDNALDRYAEMLELWESVPDAAELTGIDLAGVRTLAAGAAHLTGHHERAATLVRAALEEIDDTDSMRAATLHESLGVYLFVNGESVAALDVFESALALSSAHEDTIERARILATAGRLHMQRGHHKRAMEFSEQALQLARRLGAKREEAVALNSVGVMIATEGRLEPGIENLQRALTLAKEVGDIEEIIRAYVNLGFVLEISGRMIEARDISMRGAVLAREWGLDHAGGILLRANAAEAMFELGEWTETRALVVAAERSVRSRFDDGFVHLSAARLDAAQGDFANARRHLDEAKTLFTDGSYLDFVREFNEIIGLIALSERRPADARAAVLEGLDAVAAGEEHILAGRFLLLALRSCADLAENARDRQSKLEEQSAIDGARHILDVAEGFEGNPLDPSRSPLSESAAMQPQGAAEVARCEGRREPELWDVAAEQWSKLERPYQAAYARWRAAEAGLLAKRPGSGAADNLRSAHEIAVRLQARPLLNEIELLARRARIPLETGPPEKDEPAAEPEAWEQFGLTERELEVLKYLAEGLSNREIARQLFISPKTASAHVSNILRKLAVQTRVEAATVAFRLGLIPSA